MNGLSYKNRLKDNDELQACINSFHPLTSHIFKQLREYFRIGLTYSSNALEGNSLTETETKIILEDGLTIGGKSLKEHLEVIGHSDAYNLMHELAAIKKITEEDIQGIHRLFYRHIDEENAGNYRKINVIITGADNKLPPHAKVPALMTQLVEKIPSMRTKYHPVEFAALLHKEFVMIHPFVDGNGRTARLLMNLALLQSGFVIVIIPPVVRNDYICALKKAGVGDDQPFINFISSMTYESQRDYLRILETLNE